MEASVSRVVYNPYVLYLLLTKLRYLTRVTWRYYAQYAADNNNNLLDYVILNNLHTEVLTLDLEAMQSAMQKEKFAFDLSFCNYEFYLFRVLVVFRMPMSHMDELFGTRYYKCELDALLKLTEKGMYEGKIQNLVRLYIEAFYFNAADGRRCQRRVELFMHVKHTMEQEVGEGILDKEDNDFAVEYDNELAATLFYIHLFEEFLCLQESQARQVDREQQQPGIEEFKFVKRKLFKPMAMSTLLNETDDLVTILLKKLVIAMCNTYREQVLQRIIFTVEKEDAPSHPKVDSSSYSWFSKTTTPTPTTTTNTVNKKRVNDEYLLERPLNDAVTVTFSTTAMTTVKSEFYGTPQKKQIYPLAVPIEYLTFAENRIHYALFLYRLCFELRLREEHQHCRSIAEKKTLCYLCHYFARHDANKRMSSFFQIASESVEGPEYAARLPHVKDDLGKILVDLAQPIVLYGYKVLANLFMLFDCLPLADGNCHALVALINPVKLIDDLSISVSLNRLEAKMTELITDCKKKTGFKDVGDQAHQVIVKEECLAMDTALLTLISNLINGQRNEIERYERSITTMVSVDSTAIATQVSRLLKKFYQSHLDVLCQLIADRRTAVKF